MLTSIRSLIVACALCISVAASANQDLANAIVNIQVNKVRSWDDGYSNSSQGTGFVIDAEQGIILTNRHILGVGPTVAYGEFANKQQLILTPIYRDPVHDFGLYQYDPATLSMPVKAIALQSQAKVGEKISLYGNDAGQSLSIFEGVLSRIDRPAPDYGNTSTDFNTFYYQAALGTSGGSSGSPVLNANGQAIALNSGSHKGASTSLFLPMNLIQPVINKVLSNQPVTRGFIGAIFQFQPLHQLGSFGLSNSQIEQLGTNNPGTQGLLQVKQIISQSNADGELKVGDLLYQINGTSAHHFLQLEDVLNQHVGKVLDIRFYRAGQLKHTQIQVADHFSTLPSAYLDYGGANVIPIGLSTARLFNTASEGVMLANPGSLFASVGIGRFAKIEEINEVAIGNLHDLKQQLEQVAIGETFSVRYRYLQDMDTQFYRKLKNHADWYQNQYCQAQLKQLYWQCATLRFAPPSQSSNELDYGQVTSPLVDIEALRPVFVNYINAKVKRSQGIIVDFKSGLILADKYTLDTSLSVINIALSNGQSLPAEVVAIHPFLNLALLKADLSAISVAANTAISLSAVPIKGDEKVRFIGRSQGLDFSVNALNGWPTLGVSQVVFDSYTLSPSPVQFGAYLDEYNNLIALNTVTGSKKAPKQIIPATLLAHFVEQVSNQRLGVNQLDAHFTYLSKSQAREFGVPVRMLAKRERFIQVNSIVEGVKSSGLKPGDILLNQQSQALSSINQIYTLLENQPLQVSVIRNGTTQSLSLRSEFKAFEPFDHVLFWGGSFIHTAQEKVKFPTGWRNQCVRSSVFFYGSPLDQALQKNRIGGHFCLYQLNGTEVTSTTHLATMLKQYKTGEEIRLKLVLLNKNFQLTEIKVRLDNVYWPTKEWRLTDSGWQK